MQDERMRILRMLEEKKISAEDAAKLLDAVPGGRPGEDEGLGKKKLRIRVTDPKSGKQKVNLTIPIGLARLAAKFIPAKKKEQLLTEGLDIDAIMSQVMSESIGKIADVESDEGYIQISIE
jgi:hypothetical protein